jgi:sulfite reductase (NADPH) flavoprotein alpha-component
MSAALPKTAPFSPKEIEALSSIVARSSPQQRTWLSGFLAGVDASREGVPASAPEKRVREKLLIVYASETGNAEGLALKARKLATKQGFDVKLLDMADADLDTFAKATNLIVMAATWGEGDPPERAAAFYNSLMSSDAPQLPNLRFAVLGLGDTAYVNFCETGRLLDLRLEELGAKRAADRIELDLDYAKQAAAWTEQTLGLLAPADGASPEATVVHVDFAAGSLADEADDPLFDAVNPLAAEITEIVNLNGTGSSSETWHVELSTDEAGYSYLPGDAIAIAPQNDPQVAEQLMAAAGLDGSTDLANRLISDFDITTLTRPIIKAYADLTGRADVAALAEPDQFPAYAGDRQIIDLIAEHPETLTQDQLTGLLRPLPTRLYSVASSMSAHPGETHLLVSAVRWQSHGRQRNGVASHWLAGRQSGDIVNLHVKPNRHFRLPIETERPIIMIGAGTGVAPYRAFVEERAAQEATSKSWLFFGARNYTTDFLYQLDWQEHMEDGFLINLDVAFSRDQPEKIYVQDRLAARADELRGWIGDGAHIYVCGDEKTMARDVETTLIDILGNGTDAEAGRERLEELRRADRYQRDVY